MAPQMREVIFKISTMELLGGELVLKGLLGDFLSADNANEAVGNKKPAPVVPKKAAPVATKKAENAQAEKKKQQDSSSEEDSDSESDKPPPLPPRKSTTLASSLVMPMDQFKKALFEHSTPIPSTSKDSDTLKKQAVLKRQMHKNKNVEDGETSQSQVSEPVAKKKKVPSQKDDDLDLSDIFKSPSKKHMLNGESQPEPASPKKTRKASPEKEVPATPAKKMAPPSPKKQTKKVEEKKTIPAKPSEEEKDSDKEEEEEEVVRSSQSPVKKRQLRPPQPTVASKTPTVPSPAPKPKGTKKVEDKKVDEDDDGLEALRQSIFSSTKALLEINDGPEKTPVPAKPAPKKKPPSKLALAKNSKKKEEEKVVEDDEEDLRSKLLEQVNEKLTKKKKETPKSEKGKKETEKSKRETPKAKKDSSKSEKSKKKKSKSDPDDLDCDAIAKRMLAAMTM